MTSFARPRENRASRIGKVWQWVSPIALGCLLVTALDAYGLGFRIPNQDPTAIGKGNAFAATADNPAALYYNPAGITQLEGHNLQVGSLFYLGIDAEYVSPSGQQANSITEFIPVPHLHYVYSPTNLPVSFGLGMYAPFGLAVKWPSSSPIRNAGLEAEMQYLAFNPVVAWEIVPNLSLAAGPTFNYSRTSFMQGIGLLPVPIDLFEFEGDNWGYSFNVGLRWEPHEKWAFGINYRGAHAIDYEGTVSLTPEPIFPGSFDGTAEIEFPQIISGGISFRPTPDWNIEFNVDWTDWNSLDQVVVRGDGFSRAIDFHWNSSFFYEVGITRQLGKGYFASLGYFFSENTVPDETFTPIIPDMDLHVGSLGLGYRGKHWHWAVAGQIITGPTRTVSGSQNGGIADGDYDLFTPSLSVALGLNL